MRASGPVETRDSEYLDLAREQLNSAVTVDFTFLRPLSRETLLPAAEHLSLTVDWCDAERLPRLQYGCNNIAYIDCVFAEVLIAFGSLTTIF